MSLLPLYVPRDGSRVFRRAVLVKSTPLPLDRGAHYRLLVGVQNEGRFSVVGEFAGNRNSIASGGRFTLFDGERALSETDVVVLLGERNGTPVPLDDAAVQITTAFRTSLNGLNIDRSFASFLKDSGALEQETVVPLATLFSTRLTEAKNSYTTTDKAITAGGALANSDVSVVFTKPAWATRGYVKVTGTAELAGAGAGTGYLAVYDGTTDHNEMPCTIAAGTGVSCVTGYSGSIVNSTTFTLRARSATSNMTLAESLIYGTCQWA